MTRDSGLLFWATLYVFQPGTLKCVIEDLRTGIELYMASETHESTSL